MTAGILVSAGGLLLAVILVRFGYLKAAAVFVGVALAALVWAICDVGGSPSPREHVRGASTAH